MRNPNVIDEPALYPTGNGRNGVVVISTTEEQVPLLQQGKILSQPSEGHEQGDESDKEFSTS
jgi:hypothetical protein